jgi:ubiquinone/menaquinone biosynthesis C-methylase UbiE
MQGEDTAWIEYRHKLVEKAYDDQTHFGRVLEVGAGTGEHLPFVRHRFDEYTLSDLDPKTLEVAKRKLAGAHEGMLGFEVQTGSELAYSNNTFDRLVATHVLERIYQPHLVLKEWYRVLKPSGVLSVLIPTAPGIAYDYVMAREHVNFYNNLIAILRHYFPESKEAWWPLPIPSIDLNLFFVFHATINKQEEGQ